jgi:AcrR family transcriptional regulator
VNRVALPPLAADAIESGGGLVWRRDLDRTALPPTPDLSDGQRRVLRACLEAFGYLGFAGTSIRDIAAVAGVQSGTLYKHFASKEAMLGTLCIIGSERHLRDLTSAILSAGTDPREQLRAVVRAHVLGHCTYARLGWVSNKELAHLSSADLKHVMSLREQMSDLVVEVVERGKSQGVFHVINQPATLAAISSMGVAVAGWYPYSVGVQADELAADYARLALRMVKADDPEVVA